MIKTINTITQQIFHTDATASKMLGAGFYGKVYKVDINVEPYCCCIKLFKEKGFASKQLQDLETIKNNLSIACHIPYGIVEDDKQSIYALITNYIEGTNGANLPQDKAKQENIANGIVDMAVKLHSASNSGYGYCGEDLTRTWQEFFKKKSQQMLDNITPMLEKKLIDNTTYELMLKAFNNFDYIFSNEPLKPSLIHGDLNITNFLIDKKKGEVVAMIDPMNMMWGDREIELFQLDVGKGKDLNLLEKYKHRYRLSQNFALKNAYYKCFLELNHYARLSLPQDKEVQEFLQDLDLQMQVYDL